MMKSSNNFLAKMDKIICNRSIFVLLAYLTCCIWAWPAAAPSLYRSSKTNMDSYIPYDNSFAYEPLMDFNEQQQQQVPQDLYGYNVQWDRAREPLSYYDVLDDYWNNQPAAMTDPEAMSSLAELYEPPVWGQIVNEKPESELEELKEEERQREEEDRQKAELESLKYYAYDVNKAKRNPPSAHAGIIVNSKGSTTTSATTSASSQPASEAQTSTTPTPAKVPFHHQPGQKEVPLLRPPHKVKPLPGVEDHHHNDEPVIAVAQRSGVEKPSAYDTLRKYISLEDALKKEAEKRRASAPSGTRLQKRALTGKKQIVSDIESLSGQLTNLKKSIA